MSSLFKIYSPEDCDFYYDGEYQGHISGNSDKAFRFEVERKGSYRVRFVNSRYKSELRKNLIIGIDEEQDVDLDFTEVNAAIIRAEKEKERQRRLEEEKRNAEAIRQEKEENERKRRIEEEKRKAAELAERMRIEAERRRQEAEEAEARRQIEKERLIKEAEEAKRRRILEDEKRKAAEEERRVRLAASLDGCKIIAGFHEGMSLIEKNGKYGFIDINGNILCPCIYDSECTDPFLRRSARFQYLDTMSDFLRGPLSFHEGLARVSKYGKYGFIDKSGREVIKCIYDDASYFSEGLTCVKLNGKYGFIDKSGKEIISPTYTTAGNFFDGLAPVDSNKIIDKSGRVIFCVDKSYRNSVHEFSEGLSHFSIDCMYGFIDTTGREVIPRIYDGAHKFSEGLACVKRKYSSPGMSLYQYKHGFIDKSGKIVIPCIYDDSGRYFSEGLVSVAKKVRCDDGSYTYRWGFIDKTGKEVIPCKYRWVDNFDNGLAMFRGDCPYRDTWGFIDKDGREVIPSKSWEIDAFSEGYAAFGVNGKWGFVDKNGNEII